MAAPRPPVVQDGPEDVDVASGDALEEAAGDELDSAAPSAGRHERSPAGRTRFRACPVSPQEPSEQRAVSAADVDDRLVAVPVDRAIRSALLRAVAPSRGRRARAPRVLAEPRPEVGPERLVERRLARWRRSRPRRGARPRRTVREGALAGSAQQLGGRRVPEDAGLGLREHPVACERAQKRWSVSGSAPTSSARSATARPGRKRLGDVEIRDLAECACHQRPSVEVPQTVSGERALMRARGTAAATSSAPRRRGCGNRAGAGRRGECRSRVGRSRAAAPPALLRRRRRSSAAR